MTNRKMNPMKLQQSNLNSHEKEMSKESEHIKVNWISRKLNSRIGVHSENEFYQRKRSPTKEHGTGLAGQGGREQNSLVGSPPL